jgi:hypothetical protein
VLEFGLILEGLSSSLNEDCWKRNYKAVRLELKRAAHVFSSFEASYSENLARVLNQAKSLDDAGNMIEMHEHNAISTSGEREAKESRPRDGTSLPLTVNPAGRKPSRFRVAVRLLFPNISHASKCDERTWNHGENRVRGN